MQTIKAFRNKKNISMLSITSQGKTKLFPVGKYRDVKDDKKVIQNIFAITHGPDVFKLQTEVDKRKRKSKKLAAKDKILEEFYATYEEFDQH